MIVAYRGHVDDFAVDEFDTVVLPQDAGFTHAVVVILREAVPRGLRLCLRSRLYCHQTPLHSGRRVRARRLSGSIPRAGDARGRSTPAPRSLTPRAVR